MATVPFLTYRNKCTIKLKTKRKAELKKIKKNDRIKILLPIKLERHSSCTTMRTPTLPQFSKSFLNITTDYTGVNLTSAMDYNTTYISTLVL